MKDFETKMRDQYKVDRDMDLNLKKEDGLSPDLAKAWTNVWVIIQTLMIGDNYKDHPQKLDELPELTEQMIKQVRASWNYMI